MHRIKLSVSLLALLVTATAVAQANSTAPRRFTLPEHGQFVIQVPTDWKGEVRQSGNRMPPTITFTPASGKPFHILMTAIWPATRDQQPGPGFYFSATDRAPKPDEYKFLTQGVVRVGELSVTFTILTNDGQDAVVKQALDALKSATQEPTA
jgi:hypothetical protein